MNAPDPTAAGLVLRALGPLELFAAGERVALPRSKKARALLAYLAVTGRPHRRQQLCSLLWDVTDDPRAALRWTLSRLRRAMGDAADRIDADRDTVAFRTEGMRVDAVELADAVRHDPAGASVEQLEYLAGLPRGEFLESLDLPDFLDFNAWCIAERESLRDHQCKVLGALVERLRDEPARALTHARKWVQVDALSVDAHGELLRLLLAVGKGGEARQRHDAARRLFRDVGAPGLPQLDRRWRELVADAGESDSAPTPAPPPVVARPEAAPALWPFVGRQAEFERLEELRGAAAAGDGPRVALVTGEPGAGKTRLADRLADRATSAGWEVLRGRAYEAESTRPYGPWVDALRVSIQDLATPTAASSPATRDALFAVVTDRLADLAAGHAGVVLVLDDLQWLDRDSAELAHFVSRTYRRTPLLFVLLARGGELPDNEACIRALRGMRRVSRVLEVELEALSRDEVAALISGQGALDVDRVYEASAGNPLYAIELARAQVEQVDASSSTLVELVRERVDRLPADAAEVIRWGSVLGHALDFERLEALSSLPADDLVGALECLERNALLRIDATRVRQRYVFGHDVVREAIYGELSVPRRRLMHRKVAHLLEPQTADVTVATEVAHHATLGGEALVGVRACIVAANQSLRVFANADAETLARRGLRLAEELDEPERVASTLDLLAIQYAARTPDRDAAARRVGGLAQRALDLGLTRAARLGFQTLSYLRWESASMADAHANIMQAERISRSADPKERTVALAQAAKCLVLLERNLGQAEAFALEANALSGGAGDRSSAVPIADGMIAAYRGEHDAAVRAFGDARQHARVQGQHLLEFTAIEHWTMLEIDRGEYDDALALAGDLAELGGRVRPGAEAPTGRAVLALVEHLRGGDDSALDAAVEEVRAVDAKFELAFLLTRRALHALHLDRTDLARDLAADALEIATALGRASETALARFVLARTTDDPTHATELESLRRGELSSFARAVLSRAGSEVDGDAARP